MPLRSSALLAPFFLLFAACSTARPAKLDEHVASALDELRAGLRDLRNRVSQTEPRPDCIAPQPVRQSSVDLESNARLARLGDRLDALLQLVANGRAGQLGQPVEASGLRAALPEGLTPASAPAFAPASADARIQVLHAALQLVQRQRELHVENIASVNVCGYKQRAMRLSTDLEEATGLRMPVAAEVALLHSSGALEVTERTLDVAIDGAGFFVVQEPGGAVRFTRAGNLHLDAGGRIVTAFGLPLVPEISLPADVLEVHIDAQGVVAGRTVTQPDRLSRFGRIQLASFANPAGLTLLPHGLFGATPASGESRCGAPCSAGLGGLKQGFLERSNVQIADEVTALQVLERQCAALRCALAGLGVFVP